MMAESSMSGRLVAAMQKTDFLAPTPSISVRIWTRGQGWQVVERASEGRKKTRQECYLLGRANKAQGKASEGFRRAQRADEGAVSRCGASPG